MAPVTYAAAETLAEKLTRLKIAATATASSLAIVDFLGEIGVIDQDVYSLEELLPDPEFALVTTAGGIQGVYLSRGIYRTAAGRGPQALAAVIALGSGLAIGRGLDVGTEAITGTSISERISDYFCSRNDNCL